MNLIAAFLTSYLHNFPIVFAACVTMKLFNLNRYISGTIIFIAGCVISSFLIDITQEFVITSTEPPTGIDDVVMFTMIYSVIGTFTLLFIDSIKSKPLLIVIAFGASSLTSFIQYLAGMFPPKFELIYWLCAAIGAVGTIIYLKEVSVMKNSKVLLYSLLTNFIFTLPYFLVISVFGREAL